MNHSRSMSEILLRAARAKVAELTEQVILYTDRVVQDGPFKDMKLPEKESWSQGDTLPKILGTYEQELNVSIETCIARKPEVVVNIGCAEGYYAVGLALRMPTVQVNAYDSDAKALHACTEAIRLNHTEMVATGREALIKPDMRELRGTKTFYVIDCEGAELGYVENPANFKNADMIVECHDFMNPIITATLTERLEPTHDITVIREGPRDPSAFELFKNLNTLERFCAVSEMRPHVMRWVVALAKSRS